MRGEGSGLVNCWGQGDDFVGCDDLHIWIEVEDIRRAVEPVWARRGSIWDNVLPRRKGWERCGDSCLHGEEFRPGVGRHDV